MTSDSLAREPKTARASAPPAKGTVVRLPTARQSTRRRQILQATLRLVRKHGTGITTAQIAAESRCSKETLYSWFGSRDGIFAALVDAQAEAMAEALQAGFGNAEGSLEDRLRHNAAVLLDIMTGDADIVINRIAMAGASSGASALGEKVMAGWKASVVRPFIDLFEEGSRAGGLTIYDSQEAFDTLSGLVIGDRQRQLLLGAGTRPGARAMVSIANKAIQRWLVLYRS